MPLGSLLHARMPASAGTSTIWVDPVSGDDDTGDGSSGAPYQTINKAITLAGDGAIINVRDGTYTLAGAGGSNAAIYINGRNRSTTNPVTIRAVNKHGVVITHPSDDTGYFYGAYINESTGWRIDGFKFAAIYGHGGSDHPGADAIAIFSSSKIEIDQCLFEDIGGQVQVRGESGVAVCEDIWIHRCRWQPSGSHGVNYDGGGADYEYCSGTTSTGDYFTTRGCHSIYPGQLSASDYAGENGTLRMVIANCVFAGRTPGCHIDVHPQGRETQIVACTFYGNDKAYFTLGSENAGWAAGNGVILGNDGYSGGSYPYTTGDCVVANCLFSEMIGHGVRGDGGTLNGSNLVTTCIAHNTDNGQGYQAVDLPFPPLWNSNTMFSVSGNTDDASPMFISPSASPSGDFHIASGTSPAVAAADPDYCPPLDYDGYARDSSTPTIGAYEYTGGTEPPPLYGEDTFNIADATQDGCGYRTGSSYPPGNSYVAEDSSTEWAWKSYNGSVHEVDCSYWRWNTSTIPDTAEVLTATLRLYPIGVVNTDGKSVVGDWYDFGGEPSVAADWTASPSGTAFTSPVSGFSAYSWKEIALSDPDTYVNKTGYTGIRATLGGGAASGSNYVATPAKEHPDYSAYSAQLEVTWATAQTGIVTQTFTASIVTDSQLDVAGRVDDALALAVMTRGTAGSTLSGRVVTPLTFGASTNGMTSGDGEVLTALVFGASVGATQTPHGLVSTALAFGSLAFGSGNNVFHYVNDDCPRICVQVDFDNEPTSALRDWTDVTPWVRHVGYNRSGRSHEQQRTDAGALEMVLDNRAAEFDPTNTGGGFYPGVKPMRWVRVVAEWDGVEYERWRGLIESWEQQWPQAGLDATCIVRATDASKVLQLANVSGRLDPEQLTGVRIASVLDDLGVPNDIEPGNTLLPAGEQVLSSTAALGYLQEIAATENGILFAAADGTITFHDRRHRLFTVDSLTPVATIGDEAGEIPYATGALTTDDADIWPTVIVTPKDGAPETTYSQESRDAFYDRVLERSILSASQNEALAASQWLSQLYADPGPRIPTVTLLGQADSTQWPLILGAEISQRFTWVRRAANAISLDLYVERVADEIKIGSSWRTSLQMSPASDNVYWLLGETGYSELDETTRLGY